MSLQQFNFAHFCITRLLVSEGHIGPLTKTTSQALSLPLFSYDYKRLGEESLMRAAVVIPAYNEEKSIGWVITRIKNLSIDGKRPIVIVVDDGSTDNTAQIAKENGADVVYTHKHNRGNGAAIWTGIRLSLKSNMDAVCIIDADGQFLPEQIPLLLEPIRKTKADLVIGVRFNEGNTANMIPSVKMAGNKLFSKYVSILVSQELHDTQSGFRALSREAAEKLELKGFYNCSQEMIIDLASKGVKIAQVPVECRYFASRKSRLLNRTWTYIGKVMGVLSIRILLIPWIVRELIAVFGTLSMISIIMMIAT
jgi:glycosyltransferase involved in cell wall biosynthesis